MLESEQTLIPAFPRGPKAGASGLETVPGAGDTDHGARRERCAHPGAKAYAVAAACHATSRRKQCISHSGTFARPGPCARLGVSFRESHDARPRGPRKPLRRESRGWAAGFGKQNNEVAARRIAVRGVSSPRTCESRTRGVVAKTVRPLSLRENTPPPGRPGVTRIQCRQYYLGARQARGLRGT